MDDKVIDLLEKRVSNLELQVYDKTKDVPKDQVITDLLYMTQTMISSALSCRDNIVTILERLPKLNEYLNPHCLDDEIDVEARKQYIVVLYPQLKRTAEMLGDLDRLRSFAESSSIRKVTDLSEKLDHLTVGNVGLYQEGVEVTRQVLQALQQHTEIMFSIKMLFADLDRNISELEDMLNPKVNMEE